MLDLTSMSMFGKIRHQELLQEAEARRRYQNVKGNNINWWQRSGDLLIAIGQTLKAQAPLNRTPPNLEPK